MKILLSGFEPFNNHKDNPSELLVNNLAAESYTLFELDKVILPVTFGDAFPILKEKIEIFKPDYVICFGLAENRSDISLEEIATNLNDARIPDNKGFQPKNEEIKVGGSKTLHSGLPINDWRKLPQKHDYPVSLSQSAGTFVCNNVMYHVIELSNELKVNAGFIHISNKLDIKMIKEVILSFISTLSVHMTK